MDCSKLGYTVISDGGHKTAGDIVKALAAGASYCMIGKMFAGTDESPGDIIEDGGKRYKKYRGSASQESYEKQGKIASWRATEGDSFLVPYKGSVVDVLSDIEGGLRSAMTYVGALTLEEFKEKVEFVKVTQSGYIEGLAHGKF